MSAELAVDNGMDGEIRAPAECDHGASAWMAEVAWSNDDGDDRWQLAVLYVCEHGCVKERRLTEKPELILDTTGRRLPWSWR